MQLAKLVALDTDDLAVISALMQDAIVKVSDLSFDARMKQFALEARRFVWEDVAGKRSPKHYERRLAGLHFDRVTAVRSRGIDRDRSDEVLSLLAIHFTPGEQPSGEIELVFSGDAGIVLSVECIEAQLTDLGAAWETPYRPRHPGVRV